VTEALVLFELYREASCSLVDIWSFVYSSSTNNNLTVNNSQRINDTLTWLHIIYTAR